MTEFGDTPYEVRFTRNEAARQETYLDGLMAAAHAINSVLADRGLQNTIELGPPPDYTEGTLHEELEKFHRSIGELTLGAEIKARMEFLIKEAHLREQD